MVFLRCHSEPPAFPSWHLKARFQICLAIGDILSFGAIVFLLRHTVSFFKLEAGSHRLILIVSCTNYNVLVWFRTQFLNEQNQRYRSILIARSMFFICSEATPVSCIHASVVLMKIDLLSELIACSEAYWTAFNFASADRRTYAERSTNESAPFWLYRNSVLCDAVLLP